MEKEGKKLTRISTGDSNSSLIRTAYRKLTQHFSDFKGVTQDHHLVFDYDDQRQFLQLSPFRDPRGIDWLIAIAVPEAPFMEKVVKNTYITIALCLLALLLAVALSFYLARRVTVPLANLKQAALSLANGNLGHQIPDDGAEEMRSLANSFNVMGQQLQGSFSRLESKNRELEETQAALRLTNSELTLEGGNQSSGESRNDMRYKRLADATFEGIILHTGNIILDANKAFEGMLGYSVEEVRGKSLLDLTPPEQRGLLEHALASDQNTPIHAAIARKGGDCAFFRLRTTHLPLHGEEVKVTVLRSIDDPMENSSRNRKTAEAFNNLNNMQQFQKLAKNELCKAKRFDRPFTMLLLDIDKWNEIQDTYGYGMGDEVVRTLAHILSNQLRDIDIISHLHGANSPSSFPKPLTAWRSRYRGDCVETLPPPRSITRVIYCALPPVSVSQR